MNTTLTEELSALPPLLSRDEAALLLRRSPGTLANWASKRTGPSFIPVADGRVLYRKSEIIAWLEPQIVPGTAAA
ncbi:helix-turn-helix transcriptional regulator [Arthrobacter sp. CP30]